MQVNYNFRLEQELKDKAFAVIESFGLTPSQAIRLFLQQTAETNSIPLSFDYKTPNKTTIEALNELRNGGGTLYTSLDDFVAEHEVNA